MNLQSLLKSSAELLRMVMKNNKAPDKMLSEVFRSKKYFGSKDRKFISELLFSSLRNFSLFKLLAEKLSDNDDNLEYKIVIINSTISNKSDLIFGFNIKPLLEKINSTPEELNNIININITTNRLSTSKDLNNFIELLFSNINDLLIYNIDEKEHLSKIYSLPIWILDKLSNNINLESFCRNSLKPAPAFIRINKSISDGLDVETFFIDKGVNIKKGMISPDCYMFDERLKLDDNDLFKSGYYEIQDEGSQLISFALAPSNNSRVLDACAGAGGKSLHIADITKDSVEIIATDTEFGRLKEISKRANRCGFKSITPKHIKNQDLESLNRLFNYRHFDYVLVDAPCSGMGTIRRDPSRKYKVTEGLIQRLADKQFRILNQYSKFVKNGGILVYSTCSVLRDENENIIDRFLNENNNYVPDNLYDTFCKQGIKIPELVDGDYKIAIAFDKYFNDGFFISRLKRVN